MDLTRAVYPVEALEIRQEGRTLAGRFPYDSTATMSDRGRVRKERFEPQAFQFAVEDPAREVNLLRGHSFDAPIARKLNGSLRLRDTAEALEFEADIPPAELRPSYIEDLLRMIRGGMVGGVSPGFRVPPRAAVPDAERIEPEPGNPEVSIRVIRHAVLFELSLVSRPSYPESEIQIRHEHGDGDRPGRRRLWL